jgi:hydrogenase maturation protease
VTAVATSDARVLIIGYGNPGRGDDGLGPAFAATMEERAPAAVTIDADYQLTVEHAEAAARHEVVVFADAAAAGPEPFRFERVRPVRGVSFSTHSLEPSGVLGLAEELFDARTAAYVLGIRGYEFDEFREGLSPRAAQNLAAAVTFFAAALRDRSFDDACRRAGDAPAAGKEALRKA